MGFTKLFSSITESSIWCESDKTLRVWVAFLARATWHGIVEGSVPGLAHLCRMDIEDFEVCIKILEAPDQYSRNPENDGRRIESIPGGWQILNYEIYREKNQQQVGSRADYYRKYREIRKNQPHQMPQDKQTEPPPYDCVPATVVQQENVARHTDKDNRLKIKDKESYRPTFYPLDSVPFKLSSYLSKLVRENFPKTKPPDPQKATRHIDLMIRIDKRNPDDIGRVIEWCQKDSFWKSNILSTEKLRKQFDTLHAKMGSLK